MCSDCVGFVLILFATDNNNNNIMSLFTEAEYPAGVGLFLACVIVEVLSRSQPEFREVGNGFEMIGL